MESDGALEIARRAQVHCVSRTVITPCTSWRGSEKADGHIAQDVADKGTQHVGRDAKGFDYIKLLLAIMEKFGGGPSVSTTWQPRLVKKKIRLKMYWNRI
ncbi:hypothetical protein O9929_11100 [Vibrio lentus]|nr:hypothetical protein [Vibrio lentus]